MSHTETAFGNEPGVEKTRFSTNGKEASVGLLHPNYLLEG